MKTLKKGRFISILFFIAVLSACSRAEAKVSISGIYESLLPDGNYMHIIFDDKSDSVQTNITGTDITGTYLVTGQDIDIIISILGQFQTFKATISENKDSLTFGDIILSKVGKLTIREEISEEETEAPIQAVVYPTIKLSSELQNNIVTEYHLISEKGTAWGYVDEKFFNVKRHDGNMQNNQIMYVDNVRSVHATPSQTYFFIKTDNTLLGYGSNIYGQLGDNTGVEKNANEIEKISDDVTNLYIVSDELILILKTDNTLWGWGTGLQTLFPNTAKEKMYAPYKILDNVVQVFIKENCILQAGGSLWTWGDTITFNELSQVENDKNTALRQIAENVINIGSGQVKNGSVYVKKSDDSLWRASAKNNKSELLKIMDNIDTFYPHKNKMLALTYDGTLFEWDDSEQVSFQRLTGVREVIQPDIDTKNNWYAFAIRNDLSLWGWGGNENGQLGDGSRIDRADPIKIIDNIKKIIFRDDVGAYLTLDGDLYCWGSKGVTPRLYASNVTNVFLTQSSAVMYQDSLSGRFSKGELLPEGGFNEFNTVFNNVVKAVDYYPYAFFAMPDGTLYEVYDVKKSAFNKDPVLYQIIPNGVMLPDVITENAAIIFETPVGFGRIDTSKLVGVSDEKDLGLAGEDISIQTIKHEEGTFDPILIQPGCIITVFYTSTNPVELILHKQEEGQISRIMVKPFIVNDSGTVAQFSYSDIVNAFGTEDFNTYLDGFSLSNAESKLSVSKVTIGTGRFGTSYEIR